MHVRYSAESTLISRYLVLRRREALIVRGEVESRLNYSTDSETKRGMCINLTGFSTVRELEVGDGGQDKSDHQIDPSVNGVGGYGRI